MKTIWRLVGEERETYTLEDGSYVVSVTVPPFSSASADTSGEKQWGRNPMAGRFVMAPVVMLDDSIFQGEEQLHVRGRLLEACYIPYCAPLRDENGFAANLSVICNLVIESTSAGNPLQIQLFALRTFQVQKLEKASPLWFEEAMRDKAKSADLVSRLNSYMDRTLKMAQEVCAEGWTSLRNRYLGQGAADNTAASILVLPCAIEKDLRDTFVVGETEFVSLDDYIASYRSHLQNHICFSPSHVGETQEMSR